MANAKRLTIKVFTNGGTKLVAKYGNLTQKQVNAIITGFSKEDDATALDVRFVVI